MTVGQLLAQDECTWDVPAERSPGVLDFQASVEAARSRPGRRPPSRGRTSPLVRLAPSSLIRALGVGDVASEVSSSEAADEWMSIDNAQLLLHHCATSRLYTPRAATEWSAAVVSHPHSPDGPC